MDQPDLRDVGVMAGVETAFHTYVRRASSQLFFLFTGYGLELNINPVDFIRATGIGDRNIVILRDPFSAGYQRGIAEADPSIDGIVRWQREIMARTFPHAREVFCVGTSSGGPPAIYTGHQLGARAVWSLGGRAAKTGLILDRQLAVHELHMRVLGRPKGGDLTPLEREKVIAAANDPEVLRIQKRLRGNPDDMLDREQMDTLVALVGDGRTTTQFHFYFAETNAIDRRFAEAFAGCPAAVQHSITPPPRQWPASPFPSFTDPDHAIVMILAQRGELQALFAEYVQRG